MNLVSFDNASLVIPETASSLDVGKWLTLNSLGGARVSVRGVWENFRTWFETKIELPFPGSMLRYGTITRLARTDAIVAALGGDEAAEMAIVELYALISLQPRGGDGALLNNGWANIFPRVRDKDGIFRQVYIFWEGSGWHFDAFRADSSHEWIAGNRLFSRT